MPSIDEGVSSLLVRRKALENLRREVESRIQNQSQENTFLTAVNTNLMNNASSPREFLTIPTTSPKSVPQRKFPTLPTSPKEAPAKK